MATHIIYSNVQRDIIGNCPRNVFVIYLYIENIAIALYLCLFIYKITTP